MSKKRIFCLIMIGLLLSGISVFATYLIESSDVSVDFKDSEGHVIKDSEGNDITNVQDAIDYLINNTSNDIPSFIYNTQGGNEIEKQYADRYAFSELPVPTKEEYYFLGWYDAAEGGNKVTTDTIIDDDTTIYAHWAPYANSFSTDSWETILYSVKNNDISKYNIGDTKTVTLEGTGDLAKTYTVRVANNSTPDECSTQGFSQTACGFVIEFVDIITKRSMNSTQTSSGGWPATNMRSWLNSTLFEALPENLQNVIADTTVVSGEVSKYISTDKLYLLSPKEVSNSESSSSSAANTTRQLDYYETYVDTKYKIKYYDGNKSAWVTRSSTKGTTAFATYQSDGSLYSASSPSTAYGVSPAFRIE